MDYFKVSKNKTMGLSTIIEDFDELILSSVKKKSKNKEDIN